MLSLSLHTVESFPTLVGVTSNLLRTLKINYAFESERNREKQREEKLERKRDKLKEREILMKR